MSYTELKAKHVIPRKTHRCGWCGTKIEIKEKCFHRVYIFCGDFNNDYMHLECEQAMYKSNTLDLTDGWTPGDFKRGEVY